MTNVCGWGSFFSFIWCFPYPWPQWGTLSRWIVIFLLFILCQFVRKLLSNDFLCTLPSVERIWEGAGGYFWEFLVGVYRPIPQILSVFETKKMSQLVFFSFSLNHLELKQWIRSYVSRGSLENHTRFQTEMGKIYTHFRTKKAQKPYPFGRHIPLSLVKGRPPPPPRGGKSTGDLLQKSRFRPL